MGCHVPIPANRNEIRGVVIFVCAQRNPVITRYMTQQSQSSFSFGRPGGLSEGHVYHQPVAILHQYVTGKTQFSFLAQAFSRQPRFYIRRRFMGIIGPRLPAEVDIRILLTTSGRLTFISGLKTFQRSPGFQQSTIHGEVIFREKVAVTRLVNHF